MLEMLNFLTKEKKAQYMVLDVDENGLIIEDKDGKTHTMPYTEASIYPKTIEDVSINRRNLSRLLGTYITVVVSKKDNEEMYSRAKYMEKRVKKFREGDIVVATVVSADPKALYVEFDEGLSGKIYANRLTTSKIKQPLDIYSIGDSIKCKITHVREDGHFELSRIDLYKGKPFEIKKGDYVKCKITKKLDDNTGFFVELLENPLYSGIFDVSVKNSNRYSIGETIDLKVLYVDERRHLKLRTA